MTPRWSKFTLGVIFCRFWPFFGPFWPPRAPICSANRLFWPLCRADFSRFWTILTKKSTLSQMTPRWLKFTLGAIFCLFWPFFGPFWPPRAPICSAKRLFWPLCRPDFTRFLNFQTSKATLSQMTPRWLKFTLGAIFLPILAFFRPFFGLPKPPFVVQNAYSGNFEGPISRDFELFRRQKQLCPK